MVNFALPTVRKRCTGRVLFHDGAAITAGIFGIKTKYSE
jgi:hypothetical protein